MAEDDVTIGITVEDSTAMAKLAELQAELAKTQSAGMPGSASSMRAGISVGQVFPAELEKMASAGGRYKQVLDEVRQSTAGVTGATNELSEETSKAGINIESMMTRMAARFAIMEAARLAIGFFVNQIKEMAVLETARIQFENLTTAMEHAVDIEERLKTTAFEANVAEKDLGGALISLYDAGQAPLEASKNIDTLAKISTATGIPLKELGKGLLDLKLDKASVDEMFLLARGTGEVKDEMIGLVQQYAELKRSIEVVDHMRAAGLAAEREHVALEERIIDESLRAADIQNKAAEKAIADQQKLAGLQEGFLEKTLTAEDKPPGKADPVLARLLSGDALPQTAGGKQMTKDIQAGFQEIYKEQGLTEMGMQHFVDTGVIGLRDILEAAKRLHAAEKEARDEAAAETKQEAEDKKRSLQQGLADETKVESVEKKAEKVRLDQTRLNLESRISTELLNQENHAKEIAKAMASSAEVWKRIGYIFKTPTSELPSGSYLPPDVKGLLQGLGIIKEANSDKIEGHLGRIEASLTGHGTP